MDRRTFLNLAAASAAVGIPVEGNNSGRMKSQTIRFSQTEYYSTGEKCPKESPAEQFDNWRNEEKRNIIAISLGEVPLIDERAVRLATIGKLSYIDVLYQIPERECRGGPVDKEPLITD